MPPIYNPNLSDQEQLQQSVPSSLLQMLSGGVPQGGGVGISGNPYGGRTVAQTVLGGNPYGQTWQSGGRVGGPDDQGSFANWENQPATNENIGDAIQRGGQYRPEFARTLQSSGPEGGWFSIPGITAGTSIPWGYYDDAVSGAPTDSSPAGGQAGGSGARSNNPAPGLIGMSTNNWRMLPKQFQDPRYAMRAGHIIDRYYADKPGAYVAQHGGGIETQIKQLGGGGHGYPLSFGYPFGPRASFFPGQLEPWVPEGGPGAMGTGIT